MLLYSLSQFDLLCFQLMNSSGELYLPGEVYLSKLILHQSSKRDSGYYICLVVNAKGFQYRGAYLTVLTHTAGGKKLYTLMLNIFYTWHAVSVLEYCNRFAQQKLWNQKGWPLLGSSQKQQ
jgi:hypothetical protein